VRKRVRDETVCLTGKLGLRPALGELFYLNIPMCVKHKEDGKRDPNRNRVTL